jgi:protein-glutamine gamma-glutamyltransferase
MIKRTIRSPNSRFPGGPVSVRNKPFRLDLNGFSLAIGIVAWLLVFMWRDSCLLEANWLLYLQPLGSFGLALAMYRFSHKCAAERAVDLRLIPFALIAGLLPFLLGWLERQQDLGTPWEVLSMVVFANWTLLVAMGSRFERYQNLTAIFAGTATFVVVSMIEGWRFSLLGAAYGLLVLWWSMTSYWQKLEQKFADDQRSELSVRSVVFLTCLVSMALLGGAALLFAPNSAVVLPGLSWFSGGEGSSDEYARDGVGLGDGIRAATRNPVTFGPVESDMFMESKQPTLYDVTSDAYGHPHKIRRSSRAVGIEAEMKKNTTGRVARSQMATSDFSVARKPRSNVARSAEDQLASVLFYWKGSAPTWLAMETYNHFEDGFWLQLDPDSEDPAWKRRIQDGLIHREVTLNSQWNKPWIKLSNHALSPLFGGWNYDAIKVINLRSLRIPTPPCLEQFSIDRIDRDDFFLVGSDGIPQLNNEGSYVPPDTVVHLISASINLYEARTNSTRLQTSLEASRAQLEDYLNDGFVAEPVAQLALEWTASQSNPWDKVEAIVSRLKTQFQLDRDSVLPEDETDAATFLIENQSGTDYMFASAAACMCRSIGVPSRVVKGFWVDPRKFERKSGHTGVAGKDMHLWVEVSLDGSTWIPIEPTPGYPHPRYTLTLTQQAHLAFLYLKNRLVKNPISSAVLILLMGILILNYKRIIDWYQTLTWHLLAWLSPSSIVLRSVKLLDKRCRLAGVPRPASITPAKFSSNLANSLAWDEPEVIGRFTEALNLTLYRPGPRPLPDATTSKLVSDCRTVISRLRFQSLRQLQKQLKQN